MEQRKKRTTKYTIYWYDPHIAKTGWVWYNTTSVERAIELFKRDYPDRDWTTENKIIMNITED